MVLAELRELAGQLGITGTAGLRKGDLIAAIKEKQGSGAPAKAEKPAKAAKAPAAEKPAAKAAERPAGPEGVAAWITHCGEALRLGARESTAVCEALQRGAA